MCFPNSGAVICGRTLLCAATMVGAAEPKPGAGVQHILSRANSRSARVLIELRGRLLGATPSDPIGTVAPFYGHGQLELMYNFGDVAGKASLAALGAPVLL